VQNIMISGTDIWVCACKDQPYPAVAALEIARKMKTSGCGLFRWGRSLGRSGRVWRCWERGGRVVKSGECVVAVEQFACEIGIEEGAQAGGEVAEAGGEVVEGVDVD
jgi:hypothetical protein